MNTLMKIPAREALAELTEKQIEVLDLLVQHLTTKEIARQLGLAPTTVDARLKGVRDKWGVADRNELARQYLEFLDNCGKTTSEFSQVASTTPPPLESFRDLPRSPEFGLSDVATYDGWYKPNPPAKGLEALDERFGKLGRVGVIAALSLVLATVAVLMLAVGNALTDLL